MTNIQTAALHRRRRRIIDATFDIVSNTPWLVDSEEYFGPLDVQSQLTDFYTVEDLPLDDSPADAQILIFDIPGAPLQIRVDPQQLWIAGDLTELEQIQVDRRYSVFGNTGLFFRYALATLERHHGIFSMHASAFYHPDKNELLIVGGGTGAGKSVYLFESLALGYQVFAAEMTFFKITDDGITLYKGALHDNVWSGSIKGEYAHIIRDKLGIESLDQRQNFLAKAVVDFSPVTTVQDTLHNPSILLLLSRLEQDRKTCSVTSIKDPLSAAAKAYEVASEKLQGGYVLYERYAAPSVDTPDLQASRLAACQALVRGSWMRDVRKVVAGPSSCLEALK
jgi:hypothetical protein